MNASKAVPAGESRIKLEHKPELIALLNQQLANLIDLYSQTKFAHWNVRGSNFIAVHELFDELAEEVEEAIDMVAERATTLGGIALGTVRMAAAKSQLGEFPEGTRISDAVLGVLADAYAFASNSLRKAVEKADELGDVDTADLFTEVSRSLDKSLYFIESHNV